MAVWAIMVIWGLFFFNIANAFKEKGTSKEVAEVTSSFDVPAKEILLYRALSAEIKAITFESQTAIHQRTVEIQTLLDAWKKRHGIKDLKLWRIDTERYRIFLINKAPAGRAKKND